MRRPRCREGGNPWLKLKTLSHFIEENTPIVEAALEAALGVNPDSGDPGPTLTRSDSEVTLPW